MYLEDLNILDLCFGSGSISIEFLSRESGKLTSVDQNYNCIKHLKKICHELQCIDEINIVKSELLKFLSNTEDTYDIIFSDPPYEFEGHEQIHDITFSRNLLRKDGVLIIEHGKKTSLEHITHFQFMRIYGNVHFSFFFEE